jgi:hypothetical protein
MINDIERYNFWNLELEKDIRKEKTIVATKLPFPIVEPLGNVSNGIEPAYTAYYQKVTKTLGDDKK